MISQSAEYALRALLCLASQRRPVNASAAAVALTTRQIAQRSHIPQGYLAKVLQILVRARLVSSQRGLNGGFVLCHDPSEVSLLDVVSAVEPSRRIRTCPLGLSGHRDQLCPLHRRLDEAAAGVEQILRATTLADVVAESTRCGSASLCAQDRGTIPCKR
jgi:Rrf2 family protein